LSGRLSGELGDAREEILDAEWLAEDAVGPQLVLK
jgi:hypothetical protein